MSRVTEKYQKTVADAAGRDRSEWYRVVAAFLGGGLFLVIVPAILYWIGNAIYNGFLVPNVETIRGVVAWVSMIGGLLILGWATYCQAVQGRGTPNPMVPTQKLIVTGPYKWCRNPIQLGAMLYYFGVGTVLSSIWVGLLMFLLALILGSLFHKHFEERELKLRFGREYEDYKAKTPFLFPKLW